MVMLDIYQKKEYLDKNPVKKVILKKREELSKTMCKLEPTLVKTGVSDELKEELSRNLFFLEDFTLNQLHKEMAAKKDFGNGIVEIAEQELMQDQSQSDLFILLLLQRQINATQTQLLLD